MAQNDSLKYCQTYNGSICYREFGVHNDSVILLLHGIPGSSHCFDSLASLLSYRYHVIVPDLLGFGNSSKPKFDYYMTAQAEAVSSLLIHKGIKELAVFGHDFGGPVALTFMRLFSFPKVNKLILSSTNVFTDTYIPPPLRMAKVPILRDLFFWMMAGSRMGMDITYKQAVKQKDTYTHQMFNKSVTKNSMRYTNRIFKKSLSNLKLHYRDIHNYLSEIKIPVLVLWGDADPFFAVDVGERIAKALQKGSHIVYPKTGHYVPSEQPKLVSIDVFKFLDNGN